ncbi:MAG TPA: UDP-4-amino-4,6-dideoxy-N-acetyl-beta-L-altrosamine transaminase [Cyanobacteria bacterium UBA9579]|nr:UDP-4-amino-4,6-dideoxy-N-acetyl-beta-L-altrosamine transaminase [Cyanobacteria bacterium UBA9579]
MIPYGRQQITEDDINAVVKVLHSDFLTQGPVVPMFEKAVAKYCNSMEAIAVNSATSALHIACLSLNVGKDDIVWTTPITFLATANCARYCGAKVDFVDIDPDTFNISIGCLNEKLRIAKVSSGLPKVLIVTHMCGQPCEMEQIADLSKKYGFKIIEDAAHALGSKYQGVLTGSCLFSDITVFSFHPVKHITTGEGGMALTNDAELAKKMRLLRSHGMTRDPSEMTNISPGGWYYEQIELGFNYRMTDIQAALGLSQLNRINQFIDRRREIASNYSRLFKDLPIKPQTSISESYNSYHLYVIRLILSEISKTRAEIFKLLRDYGIGVSVHYIPVYLQPYYQRLGFTKGYCKEAEKYYSEAISLPIFPDLSEGEQIKVVEALKEALT